MSIEITPAKSSDRIPLDVFFEGVLVDTFHKNGLNHLRQELADEIADKRRCLKAYYESQGKDYYFLVARTNGRIVGTIACGPANPLIVTETQGKLKDILEIGTVFVHPDYQGKGLGMELVGEIQKVLTRKGAQSFCLDSGYPLAQKIWTKKLGHPQYYLENYWGEGSHHMIWHRPIDSL